MGNLNVDLWQTFDFATLTTGNLDANDNFATTGLWSITDTGTKLSTTTGSEKRVDGTINKILTDGNGSRGFAFDASANNVPAFVQFTFTGGPGAQNKVATGFWMNVPANMAGSFTEEDVLVLSTQLGAKQMYIKVSDQLNGTGTGLRIHIFNPIDGYSIGTVIQTATWYWVSTTYTDGANTNGMGLFVFRQNGEFVGGGPQWRSTAADLGVINAQFGSLIGGNPVTGSFLFDDFMMKWTSQLDFPLGPGTVAPDTRPSRLHGIEASYW